MVYAPTRRTAGVRFTSIDSTSIVADPACSVYVRSTSRPAPVTDEPAVPKRNTIWPASVPPAWADASSTSHVPLEVSGTPFTVRLKSLDDGPAHERPLGPSASDEVTMPPGNPRVIFHVRWIRALPRTRSPHAPTRRRRPHAPAPSAQRALPTLRRPPRRATGWFLDVYRRHARESVQKLSRSAC